MNDPAYILISGRRQEPTRETRTNQFRPLACKYDNVNDNNNTRARGASGVLLFPSVGMLMGIDHEWE